MTPDRQALASPSVFGDSSPEAALAAPSPRLRSLMPGSTARMRKEQPRQLPAFALAVLWALAAVSGSSLVLMLDQSSSRPGLFAAGSGLQATAAEALSRQEAASLARAVLLRLDDANRTGNYSIFRERAAASFQRMNAAADLQRIF